MSHRRRNLNTGWLVGVIVLAIVYAALLYFGGTLTGTARLDGIVGVVLGLFICSHPSANVVDVLIFGRILGRQGMSKRTYILWWVLNAVVFVIGFIVIVSGTTRFTAGR